MAETNPPKKAKNNEVAIPKEIASGLVAVVKRFTISTIEREMPTGIPRTMNPKKRLNLILKCKKQSNRKRTNDSHKTASTTFPGIFSPANQTKGKEAGERHSQESNLESGCFLKGWILS